MIERENGIDPFPTSVDTRLTVCRHPVDLAAVAGSSWITAPSEITGSATVGENSLAADKRADFWNCVLSRPPLVVGPCRRAARPKHRNFSTSPAGSGSLGGRTGATNSTVERHGTIDATITTGWNDIWHLCS